MSSSSIANPLRRWHKNMGKLKNAVMALLTLALVMIACANDTAVRPALDTVPPSPPVGIGVAARGGDLVQIVWSQNAEADLAGYRVYRAPGETDQFSQVSTTTLVCPWFYDHVAPMETACFRVTAVDENGNESAFSQAVSIYLNNGWRNPPSQPLEPR